MPESVRTALLVADFVWLTGWVLACAIDVTVARWPQASGARQRRPSAPVRWLGLFFLWPLSLAAIFGARRRAR